MGYSNKKIKSRFLNEAFEKNKRPTNCFLVPIDNCDEAIDFNRFEMLQSDDIILSELDMKLWNAWNFLTPEAKAYFFPGIVASTFSGDYGMFMMVDKLLREIGGFDECSRNIRVWGDYFWKFWAAGFPAVGPLASDWIEFLNVENSENSGLLQIFDLTIKIEKAKAILQELNDGNINPIILL